MTKPPPNRSSAALALVDRADALLRRVRLARWAGATAHWLAVALAMAGAVILLVRSAFGWSEGPAALWLGLAALAPLAALLAARRSPLTTEQAVARLDVGSGGAGALLTAYELGAAAPADGSDRAWQAQLERQLEALPEPPRIDWRRLAWPWPAALVFALACLFVPIAGLAPASAEGTAEMLGDRVDELRFQLDALEERLELDPEEALALEERVGRLDEELDAAGFQEAFEGIDRLSDELDRMGEEAQANAEQALQKMQAAAESMAHSPSAASAQVSEALEQLAKSGLELSLPSGLEEEFAELAKSLADGLDGAEGLETPEAAAELAESLAELAGLSSQLSEALSEALSELGESGLEGAEGDLAQIEWSPELIEALAEALKNSELTSGECELARGGGT